MTPYASQIPCFEIAAVARVPRRFSFAAAWFRGTRKLVAPIDLPRRRIPCRALQSRYLAVCVRPVSAVQGPPVLHAPLAHKYRDMAGRRTDGDFARTHQHSVQPWQVPRLQVQSACRSREQRFLHGDEILVGVEHDVAHAGATEPVAPAEQSEAVMEYDYGFRAQYGAQPSVGFAVEALQKAQWDMRAAGGLADVLRRIRRAMEHRPAHRFVEHFDAV